MFVLHSRGYRLRIRKQQYVLFFPGLSKTAWPIKRANSKLGLFYLSSYFVSWTRHRQNLVRFLLWRSHTSEHFPLKIRKTIATIGWVRPLAGRSAFAVPCTVFTRRASVKNIGLYYKFRYRKPLLSIREGKSICDYKRSRTSSKPPICYSSIHALEGGRRLLTQSFVFAFRLHVFR